MGIRRNLEGKSEVVEKGKLMLRKVKWKEER